MCPHTVKKPDKHIAISNSLIVPTVQWGRFGRGAFKDFQIEIFSSPLVRVHFVDTDKNHELPKAGRVVDRVQLVAVCRGMNATPGLLGILYCQILYTCRITHV